MIAVDAMGGDNAPHAIIKGVVAAARQGIPILLCGDPDQIHQVKKEIPDWDSLPIHLEATTQHISMGEEPSRAVKNKPDSSLVRAMQAVKEGRATAFVSGGNSGAVLVAAILICGRVPGIYRPAVGAFLPTRNGSIFCLDLGANVDCKAQYLYQFALMGHTYVQLIKNITNPRIALLSNGLEPYKGSAQVRAVYDYLQASPLQFIGNLESRDIFDDHADVLVCDGFVGNVMLKAIQGTAAAMLTWLKDEADTSSFIQRWLLYGNSFLFSKLKKRTDYATTGGALLLGVNHPVILAHGRSDARAITNAIKFAYKVSQEERVSEFNERLDRLLKNQEVTFANMMKQRMKSLFKWRQS